MAFSSYQRYEVIDSPKDYKHYDSYYIDKHSFTLLTL